MPCVVDAVPSPAQPSAERAPAPRDRENEAPAGLQRSGCVSDGPPRTETLYHAPGAVGDRQGAMGYSAGAFDGSGDSTPAGSVPGSGNSSAAIARILSSRGTNPSP
jgi:hypothetical protein